MTEFLKGLRVVFVVGVAIFAFRSRPAKAQSVGGGTGSGGPVGPEHFVTLLWDASTSDVVGYNIYRATVPGGPYTKINLEPVNALDYVDFSVQEGVTYYYVATAEDADGVESQYSNEASSTVP